MEPGLPGYRDTGFFGALTAPPPPVAGDPAAYIEAQRNQWLAEVEANARLCMPQVRAELFIKLLKFTTLHRQRLDITAQLEKLAPEPSLRQLTDAQLDRVLAGESIADE